MVSEKYVPCPVCVVSGLTRHCPDTNTTCTWDTCVKCGASVDRISGRHSHHRVMPVDCTLCRTAKR